MTTPPYPLPEGWQPRAAKTPHLAAVAIFSLLVVGGVAASVAALGSGRPLLAVILMTIAGFVGLMVGVVLDSPGDERDLPELLNAVVLEKAVVRPPDSWIHFFREKGPGLWMTAWFAGVGLAGSVVFAWASVEGVAGVGGSSGVLLILSIPLLLAALVFVLAGGIAIVLRYRHASFGRRPIGLSLGRTGVIRYYLDGVDVFSWDEIRAVETRVTAVDKYVKDFEPWLVITTDRPHDFSISGYRAHAWLIYTAVRFWHQNPALREELGTTFAQRRIEGWRDGMAAFAAPRRDVGARG